MNQDYSDFDGTPVQKMYNYLLSIDPDIRLVKNIIFHSTHERKICRRFGGSYYHGVPYLFFVVYRNSGKKEAHYIENTPVFGFGAMNHRRGFPASKYWNVRNIEYKHIEERGVIHKICWKLEELLPKDIRSI